MYELYTTGATLEEVGARFGLTRERVRQVFQEAGLPTRSIRETQALRHDRAVHERSDEIRAAFSEHRDVAEVGRKLDIPRAVVQEVVEAHFPPAARRRQSKAATPKYPTGELIARLWEASTAVDGPLTTGGYARYAAGRRTEDGRSWPSIHTFVKRFGSWRNALEQAGLPAAARRGAGSRRKFSEQDCVEAIRKVAEIVNGIPTITAYNDIARASHGRLPSAITITNRLGSWSAAITKAGL